MTLAVGIVNYCSTADTTACVQTIRKGGPPDLPVVIVDNSVGCAADVLHSALGELVGVSIISSGENVGFAEGCNRLIQHARQLGFTSLLIVNPDVRISWPNVAALLEACQTNVRLVVAAPVIYTGVTVRRQWLAGIGLRQPWWFPYDASDASGKVPDAVSGACTLLRLDRLPIGVRFWSDLFMYWEDVDFSLRVRESGGTIAVVPTSHCWHAVSSGNPPSPLYGYYMSMNRLRVARRWSSSAAFAFALASSPAFCIRLFIEARRHGALGVAFAHSVLSGTFRGLRRKS